MSRATAAVLALGLVALSPAAGWASGLELRIGAFFPRGESDLFVDDNELYSRAGELAGVTPNHFDGLYGGVEYSFNVAKKLEMGISIDGYGKTIPTVYRDFTRPDGSEIEQNLRLFTIPLGLSLRFLPRDRFATVQPYVTIGADVIFYQYEEFGDFIDFFDPDLAITPDHFISESTAFGAHALGGIRFYVNRDIAIVGEAKYLWAHDDMGDDFLPNSPGLVNRIDLSGWIFTGGVHLRF